MGLSPPFVTPFYTGSASSTGVPYTAPVSIAGVEYLIDERETRRRLLPALRQAIDTSESPGEQTISPEGHWLRSKTDWSHGAGQEFADFGDSDSLRYFTSKGIDPWRRGVLSLLPDTEERLDHSGTGKPLLLRVHDGTTEWLYATDDDDLKRSSDGDSWDTVTGTSGATILDLATDGEYVYIADGADVYRSAISGTTAASWSTNDAELIEFVNGRLVTASGGELFELDAAGVETSIHEHFSGAFAWTAIAGSPFGIYVGGNAGGSGEIYLIGIDETDSSLLVPILAASLPDGEEVFSLVHYVGLMVMGMSDGLRIAQVSGNGGLSYGALVETGHPVRSFEPEGQFLWFTWENYDAGSTGIGRADLRVILSGLVAPGYATDLMAMGQAQVTTVATFDGGVWFGADGLGYFSAATDGSLVPSGMLDTGWINYNTSALKVLAGLSYDCEPLNGSIDCLVIPLNGSSRPVAQFAKQGATGTSDPLSMGFISTESFRLQITLTRDTVDSDEGPVLRRVLIDAVPAVRRVEEILVTVLLREQLEWNGSHRWAQDPLLQYERLKALAESRVPVKYQEGVLATSVFIENLEMQPHGYREDLGWYRGQLVVRMLSSLP